MKQRILILLLLLFPCINVNALKSEFISVTVGEVDAPVYNVEVIWDTMEFTYNEQINYIWNNETFTYELGESSYKWTTSNNVINITNYSINPINIKLDYKSIAGNINGSFDIYNATILSNKSINSKLSLEGKLSSNNTNYIKVGYIDLMIS